MSLGQTVEGIANRFDSIRNILFVSLNNGKKGYVTSDELSINDEVQAKKASYLIGKSLFYKVIGFDGKDYILSRRELALETWDNLERDSNTVIQATITNILSNKIFVDYRGVSGLCLMQEYSYAHIPDTSFLNLTTGTVADFLILSKDSENRLLLSHKRAFGSLEDILSSYNHADIVETKLISRVNPAKDVDCVSYFALIGEVATGIIDIPLEIGAEIGQTIAASITKVTPSGLRGKFMSV